MLRLHSEVALITNSSTSIFVSANPDSIEKAKALITNALMRAGSDLKADDLYNFEIVEGDDEDNWMGFQEDELKVTDKAGNVVNDFNAFFNSFSIDGGYDG